MARWMVVTHGGTDSKPEENDGAEAAAQRAIDALERGEDALEAAVAAVVSLEADGRFGAGRGSPLAMDGRSIQMDAAVMDNRGRLGVTAGLQHVVHAVKVARQVAETPHVMLVGEGATRFAERLGLRETVQPTRKVREDFREYVKKLEAAGDAQGPADDTEGDAGRALVKRFWNYDVPWQRVMDEFGHGTVGAVVFADGHCAVAVSTGGSMPALLGRVADIGVVGCGFFADDHAAVACSGIGEHNVRHQTALKVAQWVAEGVPLQQALDRGRDLTPQGLQSALIGVGAQDAAISMREPMAHAIVRRER